MPSFVFRLFKFVPEDLLIDSNSSINTDIIIMNFLSIDCSTETFSLFIKTKNKAFSKLLQSDKSKIDFLMKQIIDFFKENNLSFDDISEILVNQGPGNFSGLRGSLAIAKGISLSKNLKLFGYNTFIWPCAKFFNKQDFIFSFIKFRDKYFIKKFDRNLISSSQITQISKDEIVQKYETDFKVISKRDKKYFDEKILSLNNLSIIDLDHNDLEFLKLKGLLDTNLVNPLYLS